jgi:hypothetical protein
VSREHLARVALRAYPSATHADEMLATVLDASAGSRKRFVRELVDLVRLGLRARATRTASAGAGRLVADGFCLAGIWLMTLDLTTLLSWRYRGLHDPLLAWPSIGLLAAALVAALVGLDRLAGAGALLWTALRLPHLLAVHPGIAGLAAEVVPALCFAVMLLAPRRRGVDPRRLAWLAVPVVLVITAGPGRDEQNPLLVATVALAAILGVAFVLAMMPTDPRLAIAGAVALSDLAVTVVGINQNTSVMAFLALAAAPTTVVLAVRRTRTLQTDQR